MSIFWPLSVRDSWYREFVVMNDNWSLAYVNWQLIIFIHFLDTMSNALRNWSHPVTCAVNIFFTKIQQRPLAEGIHMNLVSPLWVNSHQLLMYPLLLTSTTSCVKTRRDSGMRLSAPSKNLSAGGSDFFIHLWSCIFQYNSSCCFNNSQPSSSGNFWSYQESVIILCPVPLKHTV